MTSPEEIEAAFIGDRKGHTEAANRVLPLLRESANSLGRLNVWPGDSSSGAAGRAYAKVEEAILELEMVQGLGRPGKAEIQDIVDTHRGKEL